MILEDVKLQHTSESDPKSPYYFRNRIVKVTTDNGIFYTPARVIIELT